MVQHLGTSISGELLLSPGLEEEAGREEQERDFQQEQDDFSKERQPAGSNTGWGINTPPAPLPSHPLIPVSASPWPNPTEAGGQGNPVIQSVE